MANNEDLPEFRPKRKVLFGSKTSDEKLREMGREFMDAERYDDALEFFQQAEAHELAEQVARKAMDSGNVPLLMRARRVSGAETSPEEWSTAAHEAEQRGLYSAARLAYERADRPEDAQRVAEQMPAAPEQQPEHVLEEEDEEQGEEGSE
jgi:hypothetical protein